MHGRLTVFSKLEEKAAKKGRCQFPEIKPEAFSYDVLTNCDTKLVTLLTNWISRKVWVLEQVKREQRGVSSCPRR